MDKLIGAEEIGDIEVNRIMNISRIKLKKTGKKTWKRIFEKRQRRQDEKKEKTKQGVNKSRINNEN